MADQTDTPTIQTLNRQLLQAVTEGSILHTQALLANNASIININYTDNQGQTPLHRACQARTRTRTSNGNGNGNEDELLINLLINHGADVEMRDFLGNTPLHLACAAGNQQAVELVLRAGADVNSMLNDGAAGIHGAAERGEVGIEERVGIMAVLIRYGADVDVKDGDGDTVLHLVCRGGWKGAVGMMLRSGADVEVKDRDGLTAVELARRAGMEIVGVRVRSEERSSSSLSYDVRPTDAGESDDADVDDKMTENGSIAGYESNIWAGVRRDNGDGFILANYDKHDISFDAKLESICPCVHEGKDMHEIQVKLNFMRPYSMDYRIRYAKVDALLSNSAGDLPCIRGIMPQADRMEVSEQEITSGQKFTVGASGNGGPSNVNISMEGSKSRRSTFKGVRIIHGAVKDRMHASWRLYEEPGSKSGLPEIVRLLMLVHCEGQFEIRLNLSVKACHLFTFGIPRTLSAPSGPSYLVPKLDIISIQEQSSRLKQMLDVADRAATVIEDAHKLESSFSHAMKKHNKRRLIIEAGVKENHLREWTDIVDASKSSDFRILREKLLEMETGHGRRSSNTPPRRLPDEPPWEQHRRTEPREYGYGYRGGDDYPRARNALQSFSAVGPGYHVSRLA
ncbi:ankyrin repeat-containing domain protein [Aspergillus cavernicola]|uniref:Ankyrin repeat-containing domain protein n=1 Tax=Aspergillus cavernicola TaxID=176166 RepID=A0ABR4HH53_9EURO